MTFIRVLGVQTAIRPTSQPANQPVSRTSQVFSVVLYKNFRRKILSMVCGGWSWRSKIEVWDFTSSGLAHLENRLTKKLKWEETVSANFWQVPRSSDNMCTIRQFTHHSSLTHYMSHHFTHFLITLWVYCFITLPVDCSPTSAPAPAPTGLSSALHHHHKRRTRTLRGEKCH
jgi:hypothetical protein